jgi:hypothetical protein
MWVVKNNAWHYFSMPCRSGLEAWRERWGSTDRSVYRTSMQGCSGA